MDNSSGAQRKKWRVNLFDIVFIVIVLVAAWFIIRYLGSSGSSVALSGANETVVYTIELTEMYGDTAYLIQPGDALVDHVEKRHMGTVLSVEVMPAMRLEKNSLTGERIITEFPGRLNAVVVVKADAIITDSQISVPGGFIVRVGVRVSLNGPRYHGNGYIIDIERGEAP